jgi:hypothetical protein
MQETWCIPQSSTKNLPLSHRVFGSAFDKTTLTHPTQRTPAASASQDSVPEEVEVAVCGVITDNITEV